MASSDCTRLIPVVLNSLTWNSLLSKFNSRSENPHFFFPAFGIDGCPSSDNVGFKRLQALAQELMQVPGVVERTAQLEAQGLLPKITIYDEPSGHSLCVRIEVTEPGRALLSQQING
jgi:hypothetical protein